MPTDEHGIETPRRTSITVGKAPFLPERTDAANDVTGDTLGLRRVGHLHFLRLARWHRFEIKADRSPVPGDCEATLITVLHHQQRLEYPGRIESQGLCRLQSVTAGVGIMPVGMRLDRDAGGLGCP